MSGWRPGGDGDGSLSGCGEFCLQLLDGLCDATNTILSDGGHHHRFPLDARPLVRLAEVVDGPDVLGQIAKHDLAGLVADRSANVGDDVQQGGYVFLRGL